MKAVQKTLLILLIPAYLLIAIYAAMHLMSAYPGREFMQMPMSYVSAQIGVWVLTCTGFLLCAAGLGQSMKFYWSLLPLLPIFFLIHSF